MKLFLTTSLLLLLVPLAISNVIARSGGKKMKIIYDQGFYRSEIQARDPSSYWFRGDLTRELNFEAGRSFVNPTTVLKLVHNSETPTLDHLSFVVESPSTGAQGCDVAPAFKSLVANCTGSLRMREMTGEEKSKALQRKQLLAASLEAKKKELNGIATKESGEFRVLVENIANIVKRTIVESIGIRNFIVWKDLGDYGTYMHASNTQADPEYHTEKQMAVKKVVGLFGIENILSANKNKKCEESPLKDWILSNDCILAEIRPLTQEEKAELGSI